MFSTPEKGGPSRRRFGGRRKAINPEQIEKLKKKLANTPRKPKTPGLKIQADQQLVSKEITLTARVMVGGRKVITPLSLEQYWKDNLRIWEQKLEQVQVYFTI